MSDETKKAGEPAVLAAVAADVAAAGEAASVERVEFWRGIGGVRRHQQLVACEAQRDLGSIVVFIGVHIAIAGYLLESQAKRRQKRAMSLDRWEKKVMSVDRP